MTIEGPKKPNPQQPETFSEMLKHHKWDFISYVVLAIGLFLSIFMPFTGGLLVGVILGLYFSETFKDWFQRFKADMVTDGIFRDFVIIAGVLALLIASFGLCVGIVIGTLAKPFLPEF